MGWKILGATLIVASIVFLVIAFAFTAGDLLADPALMLSVVLAMGGSAIFLLAQILDVL